MAAIIKDLDSNVTTLTIKKTMPVTTIAEYEKKQAELNALRLSVEEGLTAEVTQYLANLTETVVGIKKINPSFNLDELAEWKGLAKVAEFKKVDGIGWGTHKGNADKTPQVAPKSAKVKVAEYIGKSAIKGKKDKSAPTPVEAKILAFIKESKDGVKNAEINTKFKMVNSSVNTSKMKAKGLIVKKDGKWFAK